MGGVVRDALLGQTTRDIDIAVAALPEALMAALKAQGYKPIPTGLAHGTVSVYRDGYAFELTSLRRDIYCDGRHAEVAYTNQWQEDAARRDFTINALYATPQGQIFDFFNGVEDLAQGHVRFIGEPTARITEDYLRILRFYRFSALHGQGHVDESGHRACIQQATHLKGLSPERIQSELSKLFTAPHPHIAIAGLRELDMASILWDVPAQWDVLLKLIDLEATQGVPPAFLRRLYAWLPYDAPFWQGHFRLARRDVNLLRAYHAANTQTLEQTLFDQGHAVAQGALLIGMAQGRYTQSDATAFARLPQEPKLPVTAYDLMHLGMTPGPQLGYILKKCEAWWVESHFKPGKEESLAFCQACLKRI